VQHLRTQVDQHMAYVKFRVSWLCLIVLEKYDCDSLPLSTVICYVVIYDTVWCHQSTPLYADQQTGGSCQVWIQSPFAQVEEKCFET